MSTELRSRRRAIFTFVTLAACCLSLSRLEAQPVPIVFTNDTGMSSSQIFIQFMGGQPVSGNFTDAFGASQTLQANTAYSLDQLRDPSSGLSRIYVSDFSGRIYMNYGPYGLQNLGANGGGYTPAAANPGDPNYNTRYQYWEATIIPQTTGGSTIFADLSYIDFTAISLSMGAHYTANGTVNPTVQNGNQVSSNTQVLVNATVSSSANSTLAILPQGSSSTLPNAEFTRVISPQFSQNGTYHDFTAYIDHLGGNSTTAKLAGVFVGTGPQPTGNPDTQAQTYNFTATFSGNATSGNVTLVSQSNSGNSTFGPTQRGIGNNATVTISNVDLNSQDGIYGNNVIYTIIDDSGTRTTTGITNDVYGRAVGDLLAGLSFGYVGSTVLFNGTPIGQLSSTEWWAGGETGGPVPMPDGSTVEWQNTPAGQSVYFGGAQPSNPLFYNGYAASLVEPTFLTPAYGFPLQDRLGNNLLVYNTAATPDTFLKITTNPDGTSALATGIWSGNATNGQWGDASNWVGNVVPGGNASVQFVGNHTQTVTVDTGGNRSTTGIYFNYAAGNFTIANNTITLSGDVVNSSNKTQTINSDLILGSNSTVTAAFGDLAFGGDIALSNTGTPNTLTFSGTQNSTVTGVISDGTAAGGIVAKNGPGTLTLSGNNTFSGGLTHQSGKLILGSSQSAGTGLITLGGAALPDAILQATGGNVTLSNSVAIAGNTTISGTENFMFTGPVTLTASTIPFGNSTTTFKAFTVTNSVAVDFAGAIGESEAGSSFTKAGNGTLTFSGNSSNTFTGALSVNEGVLELNKSSGVGYGGNLTIGDGTGGNASVVLQANNQTPSTLVSIASDGQLNLQTFNTTIGGLTLSGGNVVGNGTLSISNNSTVQFNGVGTSTSTISSGLNSGNGTVSFITFNNDAVGAELTVSGPLSGNGSVTKGESGTLAFTGNNTFDGTITVAGGVLETSSMNATVNLTNGALSPGDSGVVSAITLRQLSTSSSNSTAGGFYMNLATGNSSDLITVDTANGINLNDKTVFLFGAANTSGFTTGAGNFTLVSGGSGGTSSWQSAPVTGNFTFASIDIEGLTGSFSYLGGNLTFNAVAGVTNTWDGSDSGLWTTGSNWVGDAAPLAGANLVFTGSNETTVDTGGNQTAGSITFDSGASAFTIENNTITLGGRLTNNSSATQTINSDIAINANRSIAANSGNFVLNGNVALSSTSILPGTLTFSGGQNTSVNGTISDGPAAGGSLFKTGNGTLTLTGNNSFTGPLTIAGGVVEANSSNALGNGNTVTTNTLIFDGGTLRAIGDIAAGPPVTRTVRLAGNGTFDTNGNAITIGGPIVGAGNLIKTGNGTLTLVQAGPDSNTYSGETIVDGGVLSMTYNGSLGTTAAGTSVLSGGTLSTNGTFSVDGEILTLNGAGAGGIGALNVASGQATWNATITLSGNASIRGGNNGSLILSRTVNAGNHTLTIGGDNFTGSLSGNIEGTGGLTKVGNGTVSVGNSQATSLAGPGNNLNYGGVTTVQDGILSVLNSNALGNGTSSLVVDSGATLRFSSQKALSVNFSGITLSGNGSGDIGALQNNTSGLTAVSGNVTLAGNTVIKTLTGQLALTGDINLGNSTLSTESAAAPILLSGNISGGGGISTLGTGALVLSGNNTYDGVTSVVTGTTLTAASNSALGSSVGATTVATGAFFQLQNGITIASENLTLNGGTVINVSGNNTYSGNITLTNTAILQSNADRLTITGNITGTNNLIIQGEGAVYLNTTSYTGGVVSVNSGTLASGNLTSTIVNVGPFTGPGTGSPTYSPGAVGAIENVHLMNVISSNGTFLMDLGGNGTSDSITTTSGPSLSGNTTFVFNSAGYVGGGGNFTLINSPNAGIGGGSTYGFTSNIAGLSGSIAQSAGSPGTVTFQAFASTAVWNNSFNDSQWGTANNWDVGLTPTSGSAVVFTTANSTTVDTQSNRSVGGIDFGNGSAAITIGNNTITTYGDIVNNSTASQTISSSLQLSDSVGVSAAAGDLVLAGPIALSVNTQARTLTFTGANNTAVNGAISNGNATTGSVVKSGNGTVTFSANNTYTGPTTINDGKLVVNGSIVSDVTIASGGMLGGNGTVAGIVLQSGGLIAPGNSPGTLTGDSLVWNGGGGMVMDLGVNTAASDQLELNSALTKGSAGAFAFTFVDSGWVAGTTYNLIGFGSTTFNASDFSFTNGGGFAGTFATTSNSLDFTLTAIPEPTTWAMLVVAGIFVLVSRRFANRRERAAAKK